jgi:hypothetical protein
MGINTQGNPASGSGRLLNLNNVSRKRYPLPFSDFASFAQFDNPVHFDAPFAGDDFGHSSTVTQPGRLQQFDQLNVFAFYLKLVDHALSLFSLRGLEYLNVPFMAGRPTRF